MSHTNSTMEFCINKSHLTMSLGAVCSITRGERITKADLVTCGKYDVWSGGVTPMGKIDKHNRQAFVTTIAQYGSAGFVMWHATPFWANDVCYTLFPNENIMPKFLYYVMKNKESLLFQLRTDAVPACLPLNVLQSIEIPIPPLPVQEEIVRILDKFTELEKELEKELEARKKQYEWYRDRLLSFDENVKRVKIKSIAEVGTGSSNGNEAEVNGKYPFYIRSQTIKQKNKYEFDEEAIIIPGEGGVGDIFHYINGKYALHQRAYRIHFTHPEISARFAFYYMKANFKKFIMGKAVNATVSSIRKPMIEDFEIPMPPIEDQRRIVAILDRFDTLCNDITTGLPAEIAARRKQYEYYRDKLLSFEEVA